MRIDLVTSTQNKSVTRRKRPNLNPSSSSPSGDERSLRFTFSSDERAHFQLLYDRMQQNSFQKSFELYMEEPRHFQGRKHTHTHTQSSLISNNIFGRTVTTQPMSLASKLQVLKW